jgi:signal transduction histidine kinase
VVLSLLVPGLSGALIGLSMRAVRDARDNERKGRDLLKRERDLRETTLQIIASTSHELRTPLHGIIGHADLMAAETVDDGMHESATAILEASQHLLDLLDQLVDVARQDLAAPDKPIAHAALRPVELSLVIARVIRTHAGSARQRGLALQANVGSSRVMANPVHLRQVLDNLVDNAIKYTQHGTVRVNVVSAGPGRVRIEISDSGIGIDLALQQRLLGWLDKPGSTGGGRFQGSGLGLYLSQRLIDEMGGRMGFDSTPGKGSTFWVDLATAPDCVATSAGIAERDLEGRSS